MGRRPIVNGDEQDAYTRWRPILCYMQRPGVVKAIKRTTHKRERREARAAIRTERTTTE
jgi:hypothetical protein